MVNIAKVGTHHPWQVLDCHSQAAMFKMVCEPPCMVYGFLNCDNPCVSLVLKQLLGFILIYLFNIIFILSFLIYVYNIYIIFMLFI